MRLPCGNALFYTSKFCTLCALSLNRIQAMNHSWRHTVFPIATIFSFRLLGLFMLIPIFTLYANELGHASPTLIGIALGSYGLSQGLLQIPFGMLSDRFGRKSIITIGLIFFAIGSLIGAYAQSIELMIVARILQGAGAIGSVLMALLADLTPDEKRTKAMAVVGVTIGLSFSLAMIISPMVAGHYGLAGIFYLTAIMAIAAICLLHFVIPTPKKDPFHQHDIILPQQFKQVLKSQPLQQLNAGIFFQHLILTSTFFVLPLLLKEHIQQGHLSESWHFYLPLMVVAFIIMVPIIAIGERKQQMKRVFILSVALTALSQLLLIFFSQHWISLCLTVIVYFIAFNTLEASLPAQVSRQAGANNKGTAMGIYSSSQFLGIFVGGALAGITYNYAGGIGIFLFNTLMSLLWLSITFFMRPNDYQITLTFVLKNARVNTDELQHALQQLKGVDSISINSTEKTIHLLVSKAHYENDSAETILQKFITTK
jgi:MFS family permease